MHQEAIPSPSPAEEDAQAEQAVMRLLLEDRGLFSLRENVGETGCKMISVVDAIRRLKGAGMIEEVGVFVFATRVAVVSADLWGVG
ncbi:MAG TPA: hypothetical protein VFY69_08130 [Solirubrobacterales bacterium]|nr:hypothetical protein [Solirubrobacterales bacterium]